LARRLEAPPRAPDAGSDRGDESQRIEARDPCVGGFAAGLVFEAALEIEAIEKAVDEELVEAPALGRVEHVLDDVALDQRAVKVSVASVGALVAQQRVVPILQARGKQVA